MVHKALKSDLAECMPTVPSALPIADYLQTWMIATGIASGIQRRGPSSSLFQRKTCRCTQRSQGFVAHQLPQAYVNTHIPWFDGHLPLIDLRFYEMYGMPYVEFWMTACIASRHFEQEWVLARLGSLYKSLVQFYDLLFNDLDRASQPRDPVAVFPEHCNYLSRCSRAELRMIRATMTRVLLHELFPDLVFVKM